jgi:tRNA G26 N,N-dimethylase Trm1
MKFEIDQFIFKTKKDAPEHDAKFTKISRQAHKSHYEIHRRYKKFLKLNRELGNDINVRRAEKCCKMVKSHVNELKTIQRYLQESGYGKKHPIFSDKINRWINECNNVYCRYKSRVDGLPS